MGRSHKDRDTPPIKNTTLRPLLAEDRGDDEAAEVGKGPEVGHGEPLDNEGNSENTGQGVVLNEWPADTRKPGEGPDLEDDDGPVSGTHAKP